MPLFQQPPPSCDAVPTRADDAVLYFISFGVLSLLVSGAAIAGCVPPDPTVHWPGHQWIYFMKRLHVIMSIGCFLMEVCASFFSLFALHRTLAGGFDMRASSTAELLVRELEFEFVEATGLKKPVEERPSGHAAVYGASHATYGDAMIRVLPVVASRLLAASLRDGRQLPLATSPHLHPIWQTIVSDTQPPTAYLVQPRFDTTLDLLLKREPLDEEKAHRIFCQLNISSSLYW